MWRCRCDSTVVPCWTRSMGIDGPSHLHVKLLRTDITVEPLFFESEIVGLCTILVWSCYRHTASCLHAYLDSLRSTLTGLSDLALPFNTIRDLSLLVDALCNCTPTLQVLDLRHNHIDHEGLTHHFASKLKSFRRLCLSGNPFLDGSPATATTLKILSENTQKSRSMESLLLSPKHKVSFAARHAMNINRGGRRGLSLESSTNLPTNCGQRYCIGHCRSITTTFPMILKRLGMKNHGLTSCSIYFAIIPQSLTAITNKRMDQANEGVRKSGRQTISSRKERTGANEEKG